MFGAFGALGGAVAGPGIRWTPSPGRGKLTRVIAIGTLLVVLSISVLITRIGAILLVHTGLSRESARFQSRSAFTGAGFTTQESEAVVNHPVRRRIVATLMLLGNMGLVTAISTLILSFIETEGGTLLPRLLLLFGGLLFLGAVSRSQIVDRTLNRWVDRLLRRYTRLDVRDYASLMQLAGDYRLVEMHVESTDWIAGKVLSEVRLRDEGVIVLGIKRANGTFIGAPNGDSKVAASDCLILYGRGAALERVDKRRANMTAELRHEDAVDEQLLVEEAEGSEGSEVAGVAETAEVE